MRVGHINLETSMNGNGEHFIRLVEALDRQKVEQHVIVANRALAGRVAVYENVAVGPVVRSPVMAYCLMPEVDVVHAHDESGGRAGLLMTLTRSTPYVLTRRLAGPVGRNPVTRSTIRRAASLVCPTDDAARAMLADEIAGPVDVVCDISHECLECDVKDNRIAAEHLRIYRRALDTWRIPALLI